MSIPDLNDPTKTCIYLPKPTTGDKQRPKQAKQPLVSRYNLVESYGIQLEAYEIAWKKCLERVQAVVRELQTPVVNAIKASINDAYSNDVLPGLPYPELPMVVVSAPGGGHSIISDVVATLERKRSRTMHRRDGSKQDKGKGRMVEEEEGTSDELPALITHLHTADSVNLASAMKAIISGFVDRSEEEEDELVVRLPPSSKRRSATALASFDIGLLRAWYTAMSKLNTKPPQLIVVLHDFEQLDPHVMQDVFYICSKNIPHLPLVFLVDSSAPSTMSYLHAAYPRAAVALMRVCVHTAASGMELVNTVIERTFFDQDFEPDIVLGHGTLDFLSEFSLRHTTSLDAMLTVLQIAHIKHFEDPLTMFVHGFNSDETIREAATRLRQTSSFPIIDRLLVRVWSECAPGESGNQIPDYLKSVNWDDISIEAMLSILNRSHEEYRRLASRMRLGYQVVRTAQKFMRAQGYKTSPSTTGLEEPELTFMSRVMRGRVGRDVKHLAMMMRKLSDQQLDSLIGEFYSVFYRIKSPRLRQEGTEPREVLVQARSQIVLKNTPSDDPHAVKKPSAMAASIAEWFLAYANDRLVRLDQQPLWEVWNTGGTPFPSELINPAPRTTVVNALLHPHEVIRAHRDLFGPSDDNVTDATGAEVSEEPSSLELPDTSILFKRYMEAGRLINVYDLFQSFSVALDQQREQRSQAAQQQNGTGKGRAREEDDTPEEEDERWAVEVHARFMRALHELDYMGFIKHTGRKADHVLKTVYDVSD